MERIEIVNSLYKAIYEMTNHQFRSDDDVLELAYNLSFQNKAKKIDKLLRRCERIYEEKPLFQLFCKYNDVEIQIFTSQNSLTILVPRYWDINYRDWYESIGWAKMKFLNK